MESFIAEFAKMGGGYLLAGFAMYLLNAVWKQKEADLRAYAERLAADNKLLVELVQGIQQSLTKLGATMDGIQASNASLVHKLDEQMTALAAHRVEEERLLGRRGKS